jgi:hypothetical protein
MALETVERSRAVDIVDWIVGETTLDYGFPLDAEKPNRGLHLPFRGTEAFRS